MKKLFLIFGGFILIIAACESSQSPKASSDEEDYIVKVDPLDEKIDKLSDDVHSVIKGEEKVEYHKDKLIRICPVKILNNKTCSVKDTVLIVSENY